MIGCERLGTSPADTAIIGDRLDTDIVGGYRAGVRTLLVLTGVSTRAEAAQAELRPDAIFEDLPALQAAIEAGLPAT
jgi:ribonucleotide monophosphatase NagD (HAD superfamily)